MILIQEPISNNLDNFLLNCFLVIKEVCQRPPKELLKFDAKVEIKKELLYVLLDYFIILDEKNIFIKCFDQIIHYSENSDISYKFYIILKKFCLKYFSQIESLKDTSLNQSGFLNNYSSRLPNNLNNLQYSNQQNLITNEQQSFILKNNFNFNLNNLNNNQFNNFLNSSNLKNIQKLYNNQMEHKNNNKFSNNNNIAQTNQDTKFNKFDLINNRNNNNLTQEDLNLQNNILLNVNQRSVNNNENILIVNEKENDNKQLIETIEKIDEKFNEEIKSEFIDAKIENMNELDKNNINKSNKDNFNNLVQEKSNVVLINDYQSNKNQLVNVSEHNILNNHFLIDNNSNNSINQISKTNNPYNMTNLYDKNSLTNAKNSPRQIYKNTIEVNSQINSNIENFGSQKNIINSITNNTNGNIKNCTNLTINGN